MKKMLIFKNGIFEIIIEKGLENIDSIELHNILEGILDTKINSLDLKSLIERRIDKKTAIILTLSYELGKRHFFSFSHK